MYLYYSNVQVVCLRWWFHLKKNQRKAEKKPLNIQTTSSLCANCNFHVSYLSSYDDARMPRNFWRAKCETHEIASDGMHKSHASARICDYVDFAHSIPYAEMNETRRKKKRNEFHNWLEWALPRIRAVRKLLFFKTILLGDRFNNK